MDAREIATYIQMNGMPSPDEQKHLARAYYKLRDEVNAKYWEAIRAENTRLRERLKLHDQKAVGEYWCWQGDREDHPESLTCPVLIDIDKFRGILSDLAQLRGVISSLDPCCCCPSCHKTKGHGHFDDCQLAAALAEQEQKHTGDK